MRSEKFQNLLKKVLLAAEGIFILGILRIAFEILGGRKTGMEEVFLLAFAAILIGVDFLRKFWDFKNPEARTSEKGLTLNQLSAAVEQNVASIVITDPSGNILYVNPKFCNLTGYSIEEVLGKNPRILKSGEQSSEFYKKMWQDLLSGKAWHGEFHNRKKDGELYWESAVISPIRDDQDNLAGFVAVKEDTTSRKEAEEGLKRSEAKFLLLLDSAAEAIYGIDREGICTFVNRSFLKMFGYPEKGLLLGKNMHQIIHYAYPDGRPMSQEACKMYQAFHEGLGIHVEDEVFWKADGSCFFAEYWSYPQILDGSIIGAVVSVNDITERRNAEAEVKRALELKSNFISTVSHELRTPLTVITEGIRIVLDGSCGEINKEQQDYLSTVERNVARLGRLINNVLDIQKLEAGMMKFDMQESDVRDLILEFQATMKFVFEKRGLLLEVNLEENLPRVIFDKDKISQVLTNLLNNAMKFTEKGGVTLIAKKEGSDIKIGVSDTGFGIKKEDMPRLFGKFEQFSTGGQRKTGGTGLGLSICREIVIKHGGRLWAESEYGKGTTFYFTLPLKESMG